MGVFFFSLISIPSFALCLHSPPTHSIQPTATLYTRPYTSWVYTRRAVCFLFSFCLCVYIRAKRRCWDVVYIKRKKKFAAVFRCWRRRRPPPFYSFVSRACDFSFVPRNGGLMLLLCSCLLSNLVATTNQEPDIVFFVCGHWLSAFADSSGDERSLPRKTSWKSWMRILNEIAVRLYTQKGFPNLHSI